MSLSTRCIVIVCLAAGLAGCPSPSGSPDSGVPDSGAYSLPSTADSITVTTGPGRSDPEGIAAPSPSTQVVTWKDSRGADRALTLYGYLYQYDYSFVGGQSDATQVTTRRANDDAYGHPGFGYPVSHNTETDNSPIGKGNAPSLVRTTVFSGAHHAIHRVELAYRRDLEGGGDGIVIPVVIQWFVATGRDHPVWSIDWKLSDVTNPMPTDLDSYRMDTRAPYGSLNWDGASTKETGDTIGGVAWGDFGLEFTTTSAPLTLESSWTYNTANDVDFVRAWTQTTNAEMGIVETRRADRQMGYPDRVVGRERGSASGAHYPGYADCAYAMPCIDGWPYQLMNYDWEAGKDAHDSTSTKLLAWGTPYGYLGASDADLFDFSSTYDARGDRSYSTFIVLGPKCRYALGGGGCTQPGDTALALAQVEALSAATVAVASGATSAGYDDTFATYDLTLTAPSVTFTLTPAAGQPVVNPIFQISGLSGLGVGRQPLPTLTAGGTALTVNSGAADSGAFVSVDPVTGTLWLTLNRTVSSATEIALTVPLLAP